TERVVRRPNGLLEIHRRGEGRLELADRLDPGKHAAEADEHDVRRGQARIETLAPVGPPAAAAPASLLRRAVVEIAVPRVREDLQLEGELGADQPSQAQRRYDVGRAGGREGGEDRLELRLQGLPGRAHAVTMTPRNHP